MALFSNVSSMLITLFLRDQEPDMAWSFLPTWAGHGGVRDGDDLRGGAGGGRAAAVGRVVDPALAQPQVALVLARVPAARAQRSEARRWACRIRREEWATSKIS